ncbi:hypothetical protein CON65_15975 [Bacillus pseudomycoides]|uniref:Uncharacterized protein n=1 Tax=Bacillus pseudomycoides TaxID=64104 RepID=A0AA91ZSN9_9BACI|nr:MULTISPECIES: hypothetical protein [Bacillus]PEB56254.1 hypothetical protein COO03_01410 [Bacillus sp. AFS098217]PED81684.1 hypothetical protein CON65_15975 [Bacillus pseudomycoides]
MIYIINNHSIVYDKNYLTEDELENAWVIESIPKPENKVGFIPILCIDKDDKKIWYEYEEKPLTVEEKMKHLESENVQLGQQVSGLEIQLLQRDKDVELLGKTVTDLEIEVLKFQTGGTK